MPIKVPSSFPAVAALQREKIYLTGKPSPETPCAHPARLLILNLMPLKIDTEINLLRVLSGTPFTIETDWIVPQGHHSKNTPAEHIEKYYKHFSDVKPLHYDGMIITGAPVEHLPFEEVDYWAELTEIFDWAQTHVTSTLYLCWGAVAGLYYYYGIPKSMLPQKCFGVFPHEVIDATHPLFRGFDDIFYVPQSRHCEVRREDVEKVADLSILSASHESGLHAIATRQGAQFFIMGHSEYAPYTLDAEYRRDLSRNLPIVLPRHYYRDNNPANPPVVTWRAHGNLFFTNWLHNFVCNPNLPSQ